MQTLVLWLELIFYAKRKSVMEKIVIKVNFTD